MYNHIEVAMCCIMYQVGYVVSRATRTADADEGVGGFGRWFESISERLNQEGIGSGQVVRG